MERRHVVPEHPLRTERRKNVELKDEVEFLNKALLFTEILAAGFFGAFLAVLASVGWL